MTASTNAPILSLMDISHNFISAGGVFKKAQRLQALRGVSLDIKSGEVLAIVGESGCGKTTLAKVLMHVIKPSGGEVRFKGGRLADLSATNRATSLQAIFQDPYSSLNPRKTIGDIIGLPLRMHRQLTEKARKEAVLEMISRVGLPVGFYDRFPNQLSGGQRQRVAIARALILKPEVVICDEPTSALDVSVQSQILNLLQDLQAELGLTYILISHNLAVVEHMSSRVAVMYLGQIVELAETSKLFHDPQHPYTKALLASVLTPNSGGGIPEVPLGLSYPNALDPPQGCSFHPRCPVVTERCKLEPPALIASESGFVSCHNF